MKVSIFNEAIDKLKGIINNTPGATERLIMEIDALNTVGSYANRCNVKELKEYGYASYNTLYDLLYSNTEAHSNLVLNPIFIKYGNGVWLDSRIPTNARVYDIFVIEFQPYDYGVYSFKKKYCHSQSEKDYEELLKDMKTSILFICSEPVTEDDNNKRSSFNVLCINNIQHEVFKDVHALVKLTAVVPELANETGEKIVSTIFSKKFPNEIKDHEFFTEINVMKGDYDSSNLTDKEMKYNEFIPNDVSTAYEYGFFAIRSGALSFFYFHADTIDIEESLSIEERRELYTRLVRNTFQNIEIDTIVFYELVPEVADIITNSVLNITVMRNICEEGNDKAGLDIMVNYNDRSVAVVKAEIEGRISEDDICRCLADDRVPDYMIDRIMYNKTIRNANIPFDKITDISVTKPNFDLGGNLIIWEDCFKYKVLGFTVFDSNADIVLSFDKDLESLGDNKYYPAISVFTILNIILSDNPNKNTAVIYGIIELPNGTYKLRVSPITMDKKED